MDYLEKNNKGRAYLKICYSEGDLDKILDTLITKIAPDLKEPEKIVKVYFDAGKGIWRPKVCNNLVNQTRFYLKEKKVVFVTQYEVYIIPFCKIVAYDIVLPNENFKPIHSTSTQITKTDTGNVVKRAIIGGVIGGGVGAVIGGVTANKTTTSDSSSYGYINNQLLELHLKFNDIMAPVIKIDFDSFKDEIYDVAASIDVIISNNTENNDSEDCPIIKEPYIITEIGESIGIKATDPFANLKDYKSEDMAETNTNTTLAMWVSIISIIIIFIALCS